MLEIKTPLSDAKFESESVSMREAPDFTLTLCAGSAINLRRELGTLPEFGTAERGGKNRYFRIGPAQVLVLGPKPATRQCTATPLSSARVRIEVSGPKARALLAICAAVDFSPNKFGENAVALTGIHHTPVMIHAAAEDIFHIYGLRSFAQTLWDWLVDAAQTLR